MIVFIILLVAVVSGHDPLTDQNCSDQSNYMPPYEDGTILDPCNDGECWSYCDHIQWHETNYNASEFSEENMDEEQHDCLESACTNFFYGHVNLQVLEECAHFKCLVSPQKIEKSRPCAMVLLDASSLYASLEQQKLVIDRWVIGNRSLVEYNKHHFMHNVNNILDEQHSSIWNLELTVHDMNTVLEIKDPTAENDMIVKIIRGLTQSVNDSHVIGKHIKNATAQTTNIRNKLKLILDLTQLSKVYGQAMINVKDFLDILRQDIIRSYVYNTTSCQDKLTWDKKIETDCDLCDHGTCLFDSQQASFQCNCDVGFMGDYCDEPKTTCQHQPCINAGTCFDTISGFRCECPTAWAGIFCERIIDSSKGCSENPCQNNAVCIEESHGYSCQCKFGWMGTNCQYSIRTCDETQPCDHGECHFNGDTLQCICPKEPTYNQPFYKGDTCAIIQQNCDYDQNEYEKNVEIHGKPCSGHGLCTLDRKNNDWSCLCDQSYIGRRCSINIDEADKCILMSVDCKHGSCEHCTDKNDCNCACDVGFEGEKCDQPVNPCEPNPCQNHAPCIPEWLDFHCDCSKIPGSYGGKLCAQKITCADKPCGSEAISCNDESSDISGIHCVCPAGKVGSRCEKDIEKCSEYACLNDGICVQGLMGFCKCINGYTGDRCQSEPLFCENNPCGSYGTCKVTSNGYKCTCMDGFEGEQCNHNIDDCSPNLCQNDATCVDLIHNYECVCSEKWRGKHCEIEKSPCDDITCHNNGICMDTRYQNWTKASFKCACPSETCTRRFPLGSAINTKKKWYTPYWTILIGVAIGIAAATALVSYSYCYSFNGRKPRSKHKLLMMN